MTDEKTWIVRTFIRIYIYIYMCVCVLFVRFLSSSMQKMRAWMKTNDEQLQYIDKVLQSKFPEVYITDEKGDTVPANGFNEKNTVGGEDYKKGEMVKVGQGFVANMEKEILTPINQWNLKYASVKSKVAKLEDLRLEYDSRRRQMGGLKSKIESQRGKLDRTKSRGEAALDKTTKYTQHKETKLDGAESAYKALEQEVYDDLCILIKDSLLVQDYLKNMLRYAEQTYSQAKVAF